MTDNTNFKKEGGELLEKLIDFRKRYIKHSPLHSCPAKAFEGILRAMLSIARTDEENRQQDKIDSMC
jgi:hypothetical protein